MMEELEQHMAGVFALERQREHLTTDLRVRRADLEGQLAAVDREILSATADIDVEIGVLGKQISELALARASSFKCPWGSIRYTKGYLRVTYDSKALDVLWKSALKFSWLGTHRKEKPVKPRVSVEIFTEEQTES